MLETGWLMVKSLFYRDQPFPWTVRSFHRKKPLVTVKKIA